MPEIAFRYLSVHGSVEAGSYILLVVEVLVPIKRHANAMYSTKEKMIPSTSCGTFRVGSLDPDVSLSPHSESTGSTPSRI
jgi:hypothetical protein